MNFAKLLSLVEELKRHGNETEWIEVKENFVKPEDIGEYISALANSACIHDKFKGYLIYGVRDGSFELVGTDFKPRQKKIKGEELKFWLVKKLKPKPEFDIFELQYNGRNFVIFEIDAAYTSPIEFENEGFIRIGSCKTKLKDYPNKLRKIWLKSEQTTFEDKIALENLSMMEVLDCLDFVKFFKLVNRTMPSTDKFIIDSLLDEEFVVENMNKYSITNLGAILLAKSIDNFKSISSKAVRVVQYNGHDREVIKLQQEGRKGYASGFEGLVDYINDLLPSNEIIERATRKKVKMYPYIALREIIANAIIHQDFLSSGTCPLIEIFDDRIEISNAGKPLIPVERFIDHTPKSRNVKLANFIRRIGYCEETGSGIDKSIQAIELYQLPPPLFYEYEDSLRVTLYAYKEFKAMDKSDRIRACYQHCCLKHTNGEFMTNRSLRNRFNIEDKNYPMVSRIIADTIEAKLIRESNPENRSRKYVPFYA